MRSMTNGAGIERSMSKLRGRVASALTLAFLWSVPAHSAPKDELAAKMNQDAIDNDYLAMRFPEADRKLRMAIAICGKTGCAPNVLAQLHRDLGIVFIVSNKVADGKEQFAQALQLDPSTTIPKDLSTPDIAAAFKDAADKAGIAAKPAPAQAAPEPRPTRKPPQSEELRHTPPEGQLPLTAVPLYVEVEEGLGQSKVVVHYKGYGMPDWKVVDMKRLRKGYGLEIPCADVGNALGDLKYYIQAVGSEGEVLAASGTKTLPQRVPISPSFSGDPPHLPGRRAPTPCTGGTGGECPPEFPGCKIGKRATGKVCTMDTECPHGTCVAGHCSEDAAADSRAPCETDSQCAAGRVCKAGYCEANWKKNWFGLVLQQDIVVLAAAKDVCLDGRIYSCQQGDGSYFIPSATLSPKPGAADEVKAGIAAATTRVLLQYDRAVSANAMLGGRIGYAFGGGPDSRDSGAPFFPYHLEARASLWLGSEPFSQPGVRPYFVVSAGVAQVDVSVSVPLVMVDAMGTEIPGSLTAWKRAGSFFGSGGFGILYAFGRNTGILGEIRAQRMFPTVGTIVPIQIGYVVGI